MFSDYQLICAHFCVHFCVRFLNPLSSFARCRPVQENLIFFCVTVLGADTAFSLSSAFIMRAQ